jgi:hypothetical protein
VWPTFSFPPSFFGLSSVPSAGGGGGACPVAVGLGASVVYGKKGWRPLFNGPGSRLTMVGSGLDMNEPIGDGRNWPSGPSGMCGNRGRPKLPRPWNGRGGSNPVLLDLP